MASRFAAFATRATLSSTLGLYTDGELRATGRLDAGQGLSAFAEGVHFPKGSLYAKDMMRGRVGLDYVGAGAVKSARAQVSDGGSGSVGASIPLDKATSLVVGVESALSRIDAVTLGFKFAPCHHFQVSLSNCMRLADGSNRQTASLFTEPRKGSMVGILAAIGGKQTPELALGFEATVYPHEKLPSLKLRSFLDVFELTSRHELIVPYANSSASIGVELNRMEPKWTFRLNVVS